MKADYIVTTGGLRSRHPAADRSRRSWRRPRASTSASGVQIGFVKVKGSVTNVLGVDPKVVDSLFDLEVSKGSLAGAAARRARGVEEHCGRREPEGRPRTSRSTFAADRAQGLHRAGDLRPDRACPDYVISTDGVRDELSRTCSTRRSTSQTQGGPSAQNRAAIEKTHEGVPERQGPGPGRVQGRAVESDQPVPQPRERVAALRDRDRAVRHRQHARSLDHRAHPRARAHAGGRDDPATGAVARAVGGGDHRPARCVPRHRHRRALRVGVGPGVERPGHRRVPRRAGPARRRSSCWPRSSGSSPRSGRPARPRSSTSSKPSPPSNPHLGSVVRVPGAGAGRPAPGCTAARGTARVAIALLASAPAPIRWSDGRDRVDAVEGPPRVAGLERAELVRRAG